MPDHAFLASSTWIDHDHPDVAAHAALLRRGDPIATARACFLFVRDDVRHSGDHREGPVTCRASDVLRAGTGWCFAKSHLLAALLRANGIEAALAYQRLALDDEGPPFSLHGLVAARLPGVGWFRMDARGNRPGVDAQFEPPFERLAFAPRVHAGECDLPGLHTEPHPEVVRALTTSASWHEVASHLPDQDVP